MGGLKSRRKGSYNEYKLRDYLRSLGWEAHRVPASGASQGFKGDIIAKKDGRTLIVEVKSRKSSFKSIYELLLEPSAQEPIVSAYDVAGSLVKLSSDLKLCLDNVGYYSSVIKPSRALNKLLGMKSLLGSADILAIKDDNRPFLFIRYP